jgi:probable rRNA maturation factor
VKPPDRTVLIVNGQRDRPVSRAVVLRVVMEVLDDAGLDAELGIHFVTARRSALLNHRHLQHEGPTDTLTFDHGSTPERLCGELFICVAEAVRQAKEFGTTWQAEVLRYVIHGLLHLRGYDDLDPPRRRIMKREENRLVARCLRDPRIQGAPVGTAKARAAGSPRSRSRT